MNVANTYIDNADFSSNQVTDTYVTRSPIYEYISSDKDIDLSEAISITTGNYKIEDTRGYLNDVQVNRVNTVPVGTKYNVYDDNDENGSINSINDEIEYIIKQRIGVMNKDVLKAYKNMSIIDIIPAGLEYNYEKVFIENNNTITEITNDKNYGSIQYDSDSKTVKYKFNENWIQNKNNYDGQVFKLVINTSIIVTYDNYNNIAVTYINSNITDYEEIELRSNKISDISALKTPIYLYKSKDEDMELPDEINALNGDYKTTDNNGYLNEEVVKRNNDIEIGSIYNVYDKNNDLTGYWKLVEWNKDTDIISDNNIEFIGYWQYYAVPTNPKTGDNLYLFITLNLVSFSSLLFIIFKTKFKKNSN